MKRRLSDPNQPSRSPGASKAGEAHTVLNLFRRGIQPGKAKQSSSSRSDGVRIPYRGHNCLTKASEESS